MSHPPTIEPSDLETSGFFASLPPISRKYILKSLIEGGYYNLKKLCTATESDLLLLKGIREASVEFIERALDEIGMQLAKPSESLEISGIENSEFCNHLPIGQRRRILKALIAGGYLLAYNLIRLIMAQSALRKIGSGLAKSHIGVLNMIIQDLT